MKFISFFDFDDTLINGDTILYWKAFYFKKKPLMFFFKIINFFALLLCILKILPASKFKLVVFWPLCFEKQNNLKALSKEFFALYIKNNLFPETTQKINEDYQNGHHIVIISASHEFYLQQLKESFPFAEVVGSNICFDSFFPYYQNWGNMKNTTKVSYIQNQTNFPQDGKNCFAYSDSHADLSLLQFVEFAYVVRPTHKLKIIAAQNKWKTLTVQNKRQPFRALILLLFDFDIRKPR